MTAAAKQRVRMLTIDEVAEWLRISRRTAYRLRPEIGEFTEGNIEKYLALHTRLPLSATRVRHPVSALLADAAHHAVASLHGDCAPHPEWTYLIGAGRLTKIGRARDVVSRCATAQAASPVPLSFIAVARGADLEAVLHARLHQWRAHGEWFDGTPIAKALSSELAAECFGCAVRRTVP